MYKISNIFESREEARNFGRQCSKTKDMIKLSKKLERLVQISNSHLNQILNNQMLFQDAYLSYERNLKK